MQTLVIVIHREYFPNPRNEVIHREYFPNPRHEKRVRRIYANFVFLYLPASVAQPFQNAHFFLPKSEQSCFLSEVCALHHYCVHQCRIAQFVYAKGTSLQVKSIDKKCLFFHTQLLLHSIIIAISMSSGIFFFISYSALYFNMGVHFFSVRTTLSLAGAP